MSCEMLSQEGLDLISTDALQIEAGFGGICQCAICVLGHSIWL